MYRKFYLAMTLISGIVLLGFSIFAMVKEIRPEWKDHQAEYKELFLKNAKDPEINKKAEALETRHYQVYLKTLKRVERCMNCHTGVDNPLMKDEEVPYKGHSGSYIADHPIAKFGCTVCHDGQGRATNKKEAHATDLDTHWDTPILPAKYLESACARCHDKEMLQQNGAGKVAKGEMLFRDKGCKGCHKLGGVGGVLGKALDGIGSQPKHYFPLRHVEGDKTTYGWLQEHFLDPRKIVPDSEMRINATEEEADLLTIYLLTIKNDEIPKQYRRIVQYREGPMDGEGLYRMYCIACHTTGKYSVYDEIFKRSIPAVMSSDFIKTIDDEFLGKIIKEGRENTQMTAWKPDAAGLTENEINRIIKYMTQNRPGEKPDPFGFSNFKTDIKSGQKIYEIRCALCHGLMARGGEGFLGIDLTNSVIQSADPEFLAITVRDGRGGTTMVPFGEKGLKLGDQEIADVVAYIRTFSGMQDMQGKR